MKCGACGFDCAREYYMLKDRLWLSIAKKEEMLCIGCVEQRLGRYLEGRDFSIAPVNIVTAIAQKAGLPSDRSARLLDRIKGLIESLSDRELREAEAHMERWLHWRAG